MNPQVMDSENIDVAFASRPKRYNTRAASRQALAEVSNLARLSNVGSVPTDKSLNVPVMMKPGTDTEVSIVREDVFDELETQVNPHSINTKHVLVDPIAAEAYASSLKLPFGVADIDSQDRSVLEHFPESTLDVSIHRAQMTREFESMVDPDYLRHSSISSRIRTIVVNWLVDVHKIFELSPHALFLSVNLFDRFLAIEGVVVSRSKVQLVAIACFWIASKYEETFVRPVSHFLAIAGDAFTRKEMLDMEAFICNKLNFVFTVPTAIPFVTRGLKAFHTMYPNDDERITDFCHYALELALCDSGMLKYRPSMLAASAIALASHKLGNQQVYWDDTVCFHTGGYTIDVLRPCANALWSLIQRDCGQVRSKELAVRRKYSTDKYMQVALIFSVHNPVCDVK